MTQDGFARLSVRSTARRSLAERAHCTPIYGAHSVKRANGNGVLQLCEPPNLPYIEKIWIVSLITICDLAVAAVKIRCSLHLQPIIDGAAPKPACRTGEFYAPRP